MDTHHEREAWILTGEVVTRHLFGDADGQLEALSTEECLSYLQRGGVGRVAFAVGGVAVVLPVDFTVLHGQEIVFLTGSGSKLHAVESGCVMTFQIDHFEERIEAGQARGHRSGWSVLATGPARTSTNPELLATVAQLGVRPATNPGMLHVVGIEVRFVTGRRFGWPHNQTRPLHRREP
ncbi:MAG: pyridoxamine 5'-phosphate oxidase family protein [Acidimicrobiales bacterium]